jgi:hypothetical protein
MEAFAASSLGMNGTSVVQALPWCSPNLIRLYVRSAAVLNRLVRTRPQQQSPIKHAMEFRVYQVYAKVGTETADRFETEILSPN